MDGIKAMLTSGENPAAPVEAADYEVVESEPASCNNGRWCRHNSRKIRPL
jgi:hypothetical protein